MYRSLTISRNGETVNMAGFISSTRLLTKLGWKLEATERHDCWRANKGFDQLTFITSKGMVNRVYVDYPISRSNRFKTVKNAIQSIMTSEIIFDWRKIEWIVRIQPNSKWNLELNVLGIDWRTASFKKIIIDIKSSSEEFIALGRSVIDKTCLVDIFMDYLQDKYPQEMVKIFA